MTDRRPTLIALDDHRPTGLTPADERLIRALLPGLPFAPWAVEFATNDGGGRYAHPIHPLIPTDAIFTIGRDQRGDIEVVDERSRRVGGGQDIVEAFDTIRDRLSGAILRAASGG
jgi:hypothetical protein